MHKTLLALTMIVILASISACQDKPETVAEQTKQEHKATTTSIPLIQAKVERFKPVKDEVCYAATAENEFATCTQYDLQTISSNVSWINEYFTARIKKDHAPAFDNKPAVKVTLDPEMPSVNFSGASVRYIGQNYHLATFEYLSDYYPAGAAHGMYSTDYIVFDLKQGKALTLEDILLPNILDKLTETLFTYNSSWLEDHNISAGELKLSDNFYLGATGLVFVYPVYELASYAEGETELSIPYVVLKDFVKAEYLPSLPEPRDY